MDADTTDSTIDLLRRTQSGDTHARDRLLRRYLPILSRWAHGRLPHRARDLSETADLVQIALLRAFQNLPTFEAQGPGAFFGYLRQVMNNLLRDELRRVGRRPVQVELDEQWACDEPTPLSNALTLETLRTYEQALNALPQDQRELVVMRVELGLGNEEIGRLTGSPSDNAARMRVARALAALAQGMARTAGTGS